ncbi:MAG: ATP-binding cassette subfamily B protein [Saprospiraceae bacterium]|jgi:ATP-binding cassette subfamily B protein
MADNHKKNIALTTSELAKIEAKKKVDKESLQDALRIFEYIRPYRWYLYLGLGLLFLSSMVFMIFPFMIGKMLDIANGESFYGLDLNDILKILVVVLVVQGFVSYARVVLFSIAAENGIADVRKALYEKLISLPVVFYEKSRVGELISRVTGDVEKLESAFSIVIAEFVRQLILLVAGIIFLGITTPKLALIMLATIPLIVIGGFFFGKYIRKLSKERQNELADTNIVLSETLSSINAVKAFTNEFFESVRYGNTMGNMVNIALRYARGRAIFSVFIVVVFFGGLIFIIWQGALMIQSGEMTAGELVSFVTYTSVIGASIAGLANFYTQILGALGATERVREILDMEGEIVIADSKEDLKTRFHGDIKYDNVQFSYPTREDIQVLKGLSFEIKRGQKVALVGPSGSGKSTIVQLLLRFYELNGGDIYIDNKNIKDYNLTQVRKNMAIVPQEVMLFGGTIRENILYGKPNATDDEVIEAAKKSNSWEFISTFPEQLETIVGERGVKLSGGQRQRIAIARAILKDPAILLLDEATSSLDAESERVVQDALNLLMEGRTSIIIAHRLATIREVDCIFVIDKGRIVEKGTHDELSAKENGAYSSLAKLQFENI